MPVLQKTDHLRAVRTCNDVLQTLARYPSRDDAIQRLERAVCDERLQALAGAREALQRERALSGVQLARHAPRWPWPTRARPLGQAC